MVNRSAAVRAVEKANETLARLGLPYRGDADDLIAWLETETPYPNPREEELLESPYLVIHEIVEIAEVKRKGLRITKDVIIRNMAAVNDTHLRFADVEFQVIGSMEDIPFLRSRYEDLRAWCEDPLLTPAQKAQYESFRRRAEETLRDLDARAASDRDEGKGR